MLRSKSTSFSTLQGDLSEDNPKWGATKEYVEKQIDFFFKDENGKPEGDLEDGVYQFYLSRENMANLEAVLSAILHKNVKLDLTLGGTIFKEVLDNDYTFTIRNNPISTGKYLSILINNNTTYIVSFHPWDDGSYANFSVVSNKLNQPTE